MEHGLFPVDSWGYSQEILTCRHTGLSLVSYNHRDFGFFIEFGARDYGLYYLGTKQFGDLVGPNGLTYHLTSEVGTDSSKAHILFLRRNKKFLNGILICNGFG